MTYIKRVFIVIFLFLLSQVGITLFTLPSIKGPTISTSWIFIITILTIFLSAWIAKKIGILTFDFNWVTKRNFKYIISWIVILRIIAMVMTLLIQVINGTETSNNDALIQNIFSDANPYLLFLLIAIAAPIMEEFIFRGGIIGYIFKEHQIIGLIVSSILFGSVHAATDIINFLLYFLMGLGMGYCYYKTKRIEVSIAVHFVNNALGALALIFLM